MQNSEIDETQPISAGDTQPTPVENPDASENPRKLPWFRLILLGWLILVVMVVMGGYSGFQAGNEARATTQAAVVLEDIESQFEQGVADFNAGAYSLAKQRFEWVLEHDPNYPEAIEYLAQTIVFMQSTATPTAFVPTSTPTVTPTPDTRNSDVLYYEATILMEEGEWSEAINTLLNLRKNEPEFEPVEVDSMMYVAFRSRGVDRIYQLGELEGGLNDLAQAELFGPLDAEAQSARSWARFYILGASFWEVDWGQAAYYFAQVAPYVPNLHDGTNWTASNRYNEALQNYIDQFLLGVETKDPAFCTYAQTVIPLSAIAQWGEQENMIQKYNKICLGIDED